MNIKKLNKIKPSWQFKILTSVFFIACATLFVSNVYTQTTIDRLATPVMAQSVERAVELPIRDYVLGEFRKAGIDEYKMYSIIQCESGWRNDAINVNKNGSVDFSLLQINSIHKDISNADKFDYKTATAWAIKKIKKDGNMCAWVCAKKLGYCR